MTRPFRLEPPELGDALVRRRVQRTLLERWECRVVAVEASAGFGKTTALARAVHENMLAPRGTDVWLGCQPDDADVEHFLAGLGLAFGVAPGPGVQEIVEEFGRRAPIDVCLVLDDVHELGRDSSGAAVLTELVAAAPANAHFVLASRGESPVALSRLDAQGRVARLGEPDLALTDEETRQVAEKAGLEHIDLDVVGGWPALVSLAVRSGGVSDFVWEEVLAGLDPDHRRVLVALVAVGAADSELVEHLVGMPVDDVIGQLPLIHRRGDVFEPHALWEDALSGAAEAEPVADLRHRAVAHLVERGDGPAAVDIALRARDEDDLRLSLRTAMPRADALPVAQIRRWVATLPDGIRDDPSAIFFRGIVQRAEDPSAGRTLEFFEQAATAFRSLGDGTGEALALGQVAYWAHVHRDPERLQRVFGRLAELAEGGVSAAVPMLAIGRAVLALALGDGAAVVQALDDVEEGSVSEEMAAVADWLRSGALNLLGQPSIETADRCIARGHLLPGMHEVPVAARFRSGRFEELLALIDEEEPHEADERDRHLWAVWRGIIAVCAGRLERARHFVDLAEHSVGSGDAWQTDLAIGLLRAAYDFEGGEVESAAARLTDLVERHPLGGGRDALYVGALGLVYRLVPSARTVLDEREPGPLVERDLAVARALVAVDEGSIPDPGNLPWPPHPGELIRAGLLRGATEYLAVGWANGSAEARPATEWLVDAIGEPAREAIRALADRADGPLEAAATAMLSSVAVPPPEPYRLSVLGPMELRVGGRLVDAADWRRERVRSLLGFLVVHPETTRDAVMAALWPDADAEAARRSFRTTLNLLHGVLEPGRAPGEAPHFVRSDGATVRLVDDGLEVDAWTFDHLLDEAARAEDDGAPSLAVAPLREAVSLYRGDFLADAAWDDWSGERRDHYRARAVRAATRAAELLVAGGDLNEAVVLAARALEVEPWAEGAHRAVIAAHLAHNDRAAARRALDRFRAVLSEFGDEMDETTLMLERRLSGHSG